MKWRVKPANTGTNTPGAGQAGGGSGLERDSVEKGGSRHRPVEKGKETTAQAGLRCNDIKKEQRWSRDGRIEKTKKD